MTMSDTSTPPVASGRRTIFVSSLLLLVASLAIAGSVLFRATRHQSLFSAPPLAPFTDPTENDRRLRDVVGTFATGTTPGDHVLVIQADGQIRFQRSIVAQPKIDLIDRFKLGQREGHVAIVTARSGIIDVLDIDRLTYFDDVYERAKP